MAGHRSDWRHCPRCAAPLHHGAVAGEDRDVLHCAACGLVVYDNPAPTASALVVRDGALLLTRRAKEPLAGWWDLPGGFVDPGEHPAETVRRELREETGLDVEPGELIGIFTDVYGDGGVTTLNLFYEARVLGGQERPADDVSELGWFPLDRVPVGEIAFRNGRDAVAALLAGARA
jgi:8-oxo-dGTP diphosphatase